MQGDAMSTFKRFDGWLAQRFPATRAMARLGTIAAILSGIAVAFHVGGLHGYALPMTGVLGMPTNWIVLRLLEGIHPIPTRALWSGADWNTYLLLFSTCIAVNWTLLGLAADLLGVRPPSRAHLRRPTEALPELTSADLDPLVREFEELERKVREPSRPADGSYGRAA
jgi:hypothetical protein